MARYGVDSKLSPEAVIEKAKAYFGEGGLGLEVTERNPCCVYFAGGGGHVTVTAAEGEEKTQIDVETREWDYHVKRFIGEVA